MSEGLILIAACGAFFICCFVLPLVIIISASNAGTKRHREFMGLKND